MKKTFSSLLFILSFVGISIGQVYERNRNNKIIRIDSDLKGVQLNTNNGLKINSFPNLYNKSKTEKSIDFLFENSDKLKNNIETDFVTNVYVTDGLQNCPSCKIKFTGNGPDFPKDDFYINFKKQLHAKKEKLSIRLSDPSFNIKEGTIVGKKFYRPIKSTGNTQLYDPVLGSKTKFVNDLSDFLTNAEASYLRPKVFDNKLKTVEAAKAYVLMEPQVNALYFNIYRTEYRSEKDNPDKTGVNRYFSTGDLRIDWIFKKPNGQLLFSIPTRVIASAKLSEPNTLFEYLVAESLGSLLSNDSLYALLEKNNTLLGAQFEHQKIVLPFKKLETAGSAKSIIKNVTPSVVTVHNKAINSFGSGFIISGSGYILTNYHVIENGETIKVQFYKDTTKYPVEVVKVEEDVDLALLKVNKINLPPVQIGNSDQVEIGDVVYAIGTPGDAKLGQSVSKGIISGRREFDDKTFLQSDVSINPGNSGGPLINEQGEVIGIVVMKMMGYGVEGLSFLIPSNIAKEKLGIEYK